MFITSYFSLSPILSCFPHPFSRFRYHFSHFRSNLRLFQWNTYIYIWNGVLRLISQVALDRSIEIRGINRRDFTRAINRESRNWYEAFTMAARLDNARTSESWSKGGLGGRNGFRGEGAKFVLVQGRGNKDTGGPRVVGDERRLPACLPAYPSLPPPRMQQWPGSADCNNAPRPRHFG